MATAVDRRGGARWRRPKPSAWFVIVPLAIGLVVFAALHPQPSRVPASADSADWRGRSAQGLAVGATINGRWLDGISIAVRLRCDGGAEAETLVWTPPPSLYVQHGDQVAADQAPQRLAAPNGWGRTLEGSLRMVVGDRPRGTASLRLVWTRGDTRVLCRTGPVAFSLRRGATAT
jgi:hypothetical protein